MTYDAERFVANANHDAYNEPGMCLSQTRQWAGIPAVYPDATTAWNHATGRHKGDRSPPKGAVVWWTGGSHGYGHIACFVGGGKIRSTDAAGYGKVGTVSLGWVEQHWGLIYAGWSDNINGYTIPGVGSGGGDTMADNARAVWDEKIALWVPTSADKPNDDMIAGQQLNQARGFAQEAFENSKDIKKALRALAKDPSLTENTKTQMLDVLG